MQEAIGYLRVSTGNQEKNYSKSQQLEAIQAYANETGCELIKVFEDAYTGTKIDRPGMNAMYDFVVQRREIGQSIKCIYVYVQDRWARGLLPQLMAEDKFKKVGCSIRYAVGRFADDDSGEMMKQFSGIISEQERRNILRRTISGKYAKASKGYVIQSNRSLYGYSYISEPHKGKLVIDETEAVIVRNIYRWYLYGLDEKLDGVMDGYDYHSPLNIRRIARVLHAKMVPTRTDITMASASNRTAEFAEWRFQVVRNILHNPAYTGKWVFGKNNANRDVIYVAIPAIIEQDVFDRAQEQFQRNSAKNIRHTKFEYLLRGRLTCPCGHKIVGRSARHKDRPNSKVLLYYGCLGATDNVVRAGQVVCRSKLFPVPKLDSIVIDTIKSIVKNPSNLAMGIRKLDELNSISPESLNEQLAAKDKQLATIAAKSRMLLENSLDGLFSFEELSERKLALNKSRDLLIEERASLSRRLLRIVTDKEIDDIITMLQTISAEMDHAEFRDYKYIVEALDVHVIAWHSANNGIATRVTVGISGRQLEILPDGTVVVPQDQIGAD